MFIVCVLQKDDSECVKKCMDYEDEGLNQEEFDQREPERTWLMGFEEFGKEE